MIIISNIIQEHHFAAVFELFGYITLPALSPMYFWPFLAPPVKQASWYNITGQVVETKRNGTFISSKKVLKLYLFNPVMVGVVFNQNGQRMILYKPMKV